MKADGNILEMEVSNPDCDVYPQMADFTFYGGLYRNVTFIEVAYAHYDLLKDGTWGVFVTPNAVGKTRLDLFPDNAEGCTVTVTILDGEGERVVTGKREAKDHTIVTVDVKEPHLWDGVRDPYLYTAVAAIERDGEKLDEVTVTYSSFGIVVRLADQHYLTKGGCF